MTTGALVTIISGAPGAGKTALAVSMLLAERERNPERPVFVMGIPELAITHEIVPPVDQWTVVRQHPDDASISYPEFVFPDGALVIIDEAQNVYRPRAQGSAVPPHVAALERHRHKGLDFWLITQHPTMLDVNVRKVTGKHLHVRSHWAGGELLEWSEASDPSSEGDRAKATRVRYKPSRRVFGLYKSASMHVKRSRRVPMAVYVFVGVVVVTAALGWRMWNRVTELMGGEAAEEVAQDEKRASGPARSSPLGLAQGGAASARALSLAAFEPRLVGRPDSAPLYDDLRRVVAMPLVVGCVQTRTRCTCFTEQASDAGLSDAECRAWLRSPPFSPFRAVWPASSGNGRGQVGGHEKGPESGPVGVPGAS